MAVCKNSVFNYKQSCMKNTVISIPFNAPSGDSTIDNAQRIIDSIYATENIILGSDLEADDENVLENLNHINLDVTEKLVESVEVHGARIFPKKKSTALHTTLSSKSILETQLVKEGKDFISLSLAILKKIIILTNILLVRFDRMCQRALFSFEDKQTREQKVTKQHVTAYGPMHNV